MQHVKQKTDNDCVLAAVAMAAGMAYNLLWTPEDTDKTVKDRGVGGEELKALMARAGLEYRTVYVFGNDTGKVAELLWRRRALISMRSMNNRHGNHMVYWDGDLLHDPQRGRRGKLWAQHLHSVVIEAVHLLAS